MQGTYDSIAMGTQPNTTLILQLTGATENTGKCVAIDRRSESTTNLIVVDCNVPATSVYGLNTNGGEWGVCVCMCAHVVCVT